MVYISKRYFIKEDRKLTELVTARENMDGLKWNEIAKLLNDTCTYKRTGKQCRERWHNQLKPGISNDKDWSQEEVERLFDLQESLGNKWALIARELPGRTDNSVKNFFYSTLRKALRKVNNYVVCHRKQPQYKNIKEFKSCVLSKLLTVSEGRHEGKMLVRANSVLVGSREIKQLLVKLQRDDDLIPSSRKIEIFEETVEKILDFNRNCKRRKGKHRADSDNQAGIDEMEREEDEEKAEQKVYATRNKPAKGIGHPGIWEEESQNEQKKPPKKKQAKVKKEDANLAPQSMWLRNKQSSFGVPLIDRIQRGGNSFYERRYLQADPIFRDERLPELPFFSRRQSTRLATQIKQEPDFPKPAGSLFQSFQANPNESQAMNEHKKVDLNASQPNGFLGALPNLDMRQAQKSTVGDWWNEPRYMNLLESAPAATDNPLAGLLGNSLDLKKRETSKFEREQRQIDLLGSTELWRRRSSRLSKRQSNLFDFEGFGKQDSMLGRFQ